MKCECKTRSGKPCKNTIGVGIQKNGHYLARDHLGIAKFVACGAHLNALWRGREVVDRSGQKWRLVKTPPVGGYVEKTTP